MKKRKLQKIGKGAYTEAKRVSGGRFHGKVLKPYKGRLTRAQVERQRKAFNYYKNELRKAGVLVPEAEFKVTKQGDKFNVFLLMEEVKGKSLDEVLSEKKEVPLKVFGMILDEAVKVIKHNQVLKGRGKPLVGADFIPKNLLLLDGKLCYCDVYPPLIIKGRGFDAKFISAHSSTQGAQNIRPFLGRKLLAKASKRALRVDPVLFEVINYVIKYCPEIKKEVVALAREKIRKNFEGKTKNQFLRMLSNPSLFLLESRRKIAKRIDAPKNKNN